MRCGVDTGGTFTDVVTDDGTVVKVLEHARRPGPGRRRGHRRHRRGPPRAAGPRDHRRHQRPARAAGGGRRPRHQPGLRRRDRDRPPGPAVALRPVGRPARAPRPPPPAAGGRRTPRRHRHRDRAARSRLPDVPDGVEAVAVCLLHADLNPAHERAVADRLRARGLDVTCSSDVSPEFREYERTVTTVLNAYLRPGCRDYLRQLDALADEVLVMTSAGGLVPAAEAAELPVALLLSGPAGGVVAGAAAAAGAGLRRRRHLRHGRDEHRRVPGAGRRARAGAGPGGGRLPGAPARPRHPHHRRRRRVDRLRRPRRRPRRRTGERRRRPRPGLLRTGRAAARPSPTPTSSSAASRWTPPSATSAGSTSTPPGPPSTRPA